MGPIPSSLVTAVACSAAAGKNPWLPLAMIFLLAAPSSVPALLMSGDVHRQLHGLGPVELLWSLGAVFAVLAVADSLADKVGFIEKWLVPVSTAYRPFAGVACAALIGVAAAGDVGPTELTALLGPSIEGVYVADTSLWVGGSLVVLTVLAGALFSWIATMGKTGARLLMSMVPVPGLKLAHSFVDDFFAFGATFAGLAFGHTFLVPFVLAVYLAVGMFTGPLLTRMTWIHVRIGWSILRKTSRHVEGAAGPLPIPPGWATRWLEGEGLGRATVLPAYVYRAPTLGLFRSGHLVLSKGKTLFLSRIWWRPRAYVVEEGALARVGFSDTVTSRVVTLVERIASGALRQVHVTLFPAVEDEVLPALEAGAERAGLVRVRADSTSARAGLPGYADRERSVRFLPASASGSLRLQGLLTVAAAVAGGILSAGVFVPIGVGYLASPFKRRFVLGLLVSGYLSLCVFGSMGLGWPAAVLYASLLNVLTLRDLTRNALKARVEGFVDRRAWLPVVAGRVWVPTAGVDAPSDRWREGAREPLTDGAWRAVVEVLAAGAPGSLPSTEAGATG